MRARWTQAYEACGQIGYSVYGMLAESGINQKLQRRPRLLAPLLYAERTIAAHTFHIIHPEYTVTLLCRNYRMTQTFYSDQPLEDAGPEDERQEGKGRELDRKGRV